MAKPRKLFSIEDVPSLLASAEPVCVDIGYLGHDDHTNAFVDIFEKFVRDNEATIRAYESVFAKAAKPLEQKLRKLEGPTGTESLISDAREVGRALYDSLNEKVYLTFPGKAGVKELMVTLDNPCFEFL